MTRFSEALARWLGTLRCAYTPPPWWDAARAAVPAWHERHPRAAPAAAAALLLSIASAHGLQLWWRSRPRIERVSVALLPPGPMPLRKDAGPEPLRLRFGSSVAPLEAVAAPAAVGAALTPVHPGTWSWVSDSELDFTPAVDWPVGQEFRVRLERALVPGRVRLERYEHSFRSAPFTAELAEAAFHQDPRDPAGKKVVATLRFSHPVDPGSLESRLFLALDGQEGGFLGLGRKSFPFTVAYDEFRGEAYVHSGALSIQDKPGNMTVRIAAGVSSTRGGPAFDRALERSAEIPGMSTYFRIESVEPTLARNERFEPEQVLVLSASNGALESELRGALSVWALPESMPAAPGSPAVRGYEWDDPARVGPRALAASRKLELTPLPTESEYATRHAFRFSAEPGRPLFVRVAKGARSFGGYRLAETYDAIVRVPDFPRELNIMSAGSLLSLSGEKKLSVVARGLEAVRFELARVLPDQLHHLVSQSGGRFNDPSFRNWSFNEQNISESFVEIKSLPDPDPRKSQYAALDLGRYLASSGRQRGLFLVRAAGWDPRQRVEAGASDRRLVLLTDMGLIVKRQQDGSRVVFVSSLGGGGPVAGARVEVLGKNGVPAAARVTDAAGRAELPPLESLTRERQPVVILAQKGDDLSFIPYDWEERSLNLSRFDTGGRVTDTAPEPLEAYLFSDRGIYRPGDPIRVGLIVRRPGLRAGLAGVPLEWAVTDPRGLVVRSEKLRLSELGFEELSHATGENAPTGSYQFSVFVVRDGRRAGLLGSVAARVEEFLPDELKIAASFSDERKAGWAHPKELRARVALRTLFEQPAADRRVRAQLALSPVLPAFPGYDGFLFFDPNADKEGHREELPESRTSPEGEAEFALDLERFGDAVYRLDFRAEGYAAAGGRGVAAAASILVCDLPTLLAYKPDGELAYVSRHSTRSVRLQAVDSALRGASVPGLTRRLHAIRYVSTLARRPDGTYEYESVRRLVLLSSAPLALPAAGLESPLPTGEPGDFEWSIVDAAGRERLRVPFSVVGKANLARSLEKDAELQLKLDRRDYAPGEEIELSIAAPYAGAGLITIERDKVYAHKWFRAERTATVERIRVPEGLEGNAYVSVSFARAADSAEIFMSPLSAAAAPFSISRGRRVNPVELELPEKAGPGAPYRVRYRARGPGRIVVFAVDEGILQAARYATPDPLAKFLEKRALEVKTFSILDQLLPEFRLVRALSASGGDGYEAIGKNLNPFKRKREKPVAFWSGLREAGPEWSELSFAVPDYFNGSLRVMAVCVSSAAIGAAQMRGVVRGPFALSPSVPSFAAPGDSFEVALGIHNALEGSGPGAELSVSLEASGGLAVAEGARQTARIPEGREGALRFRVKALPQPGSGRLVFRVARGAERASRALELSVRPSVPFMTTLSGGILEGGAAELPVSRRMFRQFRKQETAVSLVPLGLARGLVAYLDAYPYPCTEQLVSRAFPALALRGRPEFGYAPKKVEPLLAQTIAILRERQNGEGAFGFWAANSHVVPFQTVYAAHFLTDAAEAGVFVPPELSQKALLFLRGLAAREPESLDDARVRAYALYVLARNGVALTPQLNGLRDWLERAHGRAWRRDLAAVYMAAVYRLVKLEGDALALARGLELGQPQPQDYEHYYDGLRRDAQLLYALARHFPERLEGLSGKELAAVSAPVLDGRFNTTTASYAVLALAAYSKGAAAADPLAVSVEELDGAGAARALALPRGLFPALALSPEARRLRLRSGDSRPLFYQLVEAGFDLKAPEKPHAEGLEVFRDFLGPDGAPASRAAVGDDLIVRLRLRALGAERRGNLALVDLLPGGFEVADAPREPAGGNVRIAESGSSWVPEYADVREDRVVLFGAAGAEMAEFRYRIRAVSAGGFAVPPAFGESMYDRSVSARSLGGTFAVSPAP